MRKPHPSYEQFIKEQKPKYGETFIDWYVNNHKIGDVDILREISNKTCDIQGPITDRFESFHCPTYYRDAFLKKLQLCSNLVYLLFNDSYGVFKYDIDEVANIMDYYEDIIFTIVFNPNVGVCAMPSATGQNNRNFSTSEVKYKNLDDFKEDLNSGEIAVYLFTVESDYSIKVRMWKREPLTRNVMVEKENIL